VHWIAASIIAAGFLISTSMAITFRYSIVPLTPLVGVSRLDHWTGKIVHCHPAQIWAPDKLECTAANTAAKDDWVDVPPAPKNGERPCTTSKPCTDEEVFGKDAWPGRPVPEKK
jgi:hypothetical protein